MVIAPGFSLICLPKLTFPKQHLKCIALLILMGFVVYSNSLLNPLIWDDEGLIIKSQLIKSFDNFFNLFTTHIAHNLFKSNSYRPIQMLSYMIEYHFWELNPLGYHITNVSLHILNGILVYILIFIIYKKTIVSLITSMFFVVHPVFVNSVTYVSGRADSLAGFFILLGIILSIKYSDFFDFRRTLFFIFSIVCFIFALLSKELAIIFPLTMLLYDFCFRRSHLKSIRAVIKNYLPFLIIAILYAILRLTWLNFMPDEIMPMGKYPVTFRILIFLKAIFLYLRILLFPIDIHMLRNIYLSKSLFEPLVLIAFLGVLAIFVALLSFYKKSPYVFFFGIWFFIFLLPQSGIYPISAAVSDHFIYLPSIGFFFILAILLTKINPKIIMFILVFFLLVFFSKLTSKQNEIWSDEERLFKYLIKLSPYSFESHANLASFYLKHGFDSLAMKELNETLRIDSNSYKALFPYGNLAFLYHKKKEYEKALEIHKLILNKFPDYRPADVHNLIGANYMQLNKYDEALKEFQLSLDKDSNYYPARFNIALVYKRQGKLKEAVKELLLSLSDDKSMYLRLSSLNKPQIEEYEEIIKEGKSPFEVYDKLAKLFLKYDLFDVAEQSFKRAIDLFPDNPDSHWNLGSLYYRQGRLKEAKWEWKIVLRIDPHHPYAKEWLTKIK